jgi:uncharacterized protein (DUF58 family)
MRSIIPALLFLLVLALTFRIDLYFTIVWFLIGLYVLSRLWTRRAAQSLSVQRRFPARAFNGDHITVELSLRNRSRLPVPWVEVEESVPIEMRETAVPSQAFALSSRGHREWSYTLACRHRGYYRLGPLRTQTGDLLGLEQRLILLQEDRYLTVYPRVVPLDRLGLPTRSALTSLPARMPLFDDPSRIMGVRDYRAGDSPRRIHWPATARTGSVLVKQYQPAIARDTHICLDLALRGYPLRERHAATEMAIVAAASLAYHIIVREGLPAGLAVLGSVPVSFPPRAERYHLIEMLEALARVTVTSEGGFTDLLRRESLHLPWGSTMLAITGQIEPTLAAMLLHLKRTGHAVGVVVLQRGSVGAEEQARLPGIPVHHVWQDLDLGALA